MTHTCIGIWQQQACVHKLPALDCPSPPRFSLFPFIVLAPTEMKHVIENTCAGALVQQLVCAVVFRQYRHRPVMRLTAMERGERGLCESETT